MADANELKTGDANSPWGRGRVYRSVSETIGNTPLVQLSRMAEEVHAKGTVLLKLEFFNPLSSIKDRIGVAMIDALEAQGRIKPRTTTLIEPTSGNTGIALAFVAAERGYRLILVMPDSMSLERRRMLLHLGAEIEFTPAAGGMGATVVRANELLREIPDAIMPAQFDNPTNPLVHEKTTAEEIWADTGGKVDAIVAGVGTGGTITGVGRVLKARKPEIKVIAVEPATSPVLSKGEAGPHKIQGIGPGFVPSILARELLDEIITVSNEQAINTAKILARREGIPGGFSTGANVFAALLVAHRPEYAGKTIVTFAPSHADRYLSTDLLFV
jgi:cysteine synthase A